MQHDLIRLPLEVELGKELYTLIQGDIIEKIINEAQVEKIESNWKYILEGHSFKIGEELAPKLHTMCQEIQTKLEFDEPIDFYITNSPELNAFALSRSHNETSHIINLNSGIVEMLDDDELRFVIGHEIGHLISGNARIMMLLQFVYPQNNNVPLMLHHKIGLWNKLSELTADRFGFLACPNIDKVLSNFFKLSSGLNPSRINFDPKSYSKKNEKTLAYFKEHAAGNMLSHPINPLRIKAVELFDQSKTFKDIKADKTLEFDKDLDVLIKDLTETIKTLSSSEMDLHRKNFVACAGLILAQIDKKMEKKEYENIVHFLSQYTIFPKKYLEEISQKDVVKIFNEAVSKIMAQNPGERYQLIDYIIRLALSDHQLDNEELKFIYQFGEGIGFQKKELAQIIAASIQQYYVPDILA